MARMVREGGRDDRGGEGMEGEGQVARTAEAIIRQMWRG